MKKYEKIYTTSELELSFLGDSIINLVKIVNREERQTENGADSKYYWRLMGMLQAISNMNIPFEISYDCSGCAQITAIKIMDMEFKVEEE